MPAPSKAAFLAAGVSRDILSLEQASLAALQPVLAAAQAELAQDFHKWLQKLGPNAAEIKYTAAHVRQLQLLLGVAQGQMRRPHAPLGTAVSFAIRKILKEAHVPRVALRTLEAQLRRLEATFSDMPPPQLIQAAWMARGDQLLINRYNASALRYAGNANMDLRFQTAVGIAKGETIEQMIKRLSGISSFQAAVRPPLTQGAKEVAAGLTKRYSYWAERLIRTELVNGYNVAAMEGIKEVHRYDERAVAVWDASLDRRVCRYCRKLHGTHVTPGSRFSGKFDHPPAHPNCRCAVIVWIEADWGSLATHMEMVGT